jgi:hypothetical protein
MTRRDLFTLVAFGLAAGTPAWGIISGIITPFMVLYALHNAMVKPMPGHPLAPGPAEACSASADGLSYEFALRRGTVFHDAIR